MSIKADKEDGSTRNSSEYEKVDLEKGHEESGKEIETTEDKVSITSSKPLRSLMHLDGNWLAIRGPMELKMILDMISKSTCLGKVPESSNSRQKNTH